MTDAYFIAIVWLLFVAAFGIGYLAKGSLRDYNSIGRVVPPLSTVLIIATVFGSLKTPTLSDAAKASILGFWLTIPPTWFCFEYFCFYRPLYLIEAKKAGVINPEVDGINWEQFKYGQESSAKVWAGVVLFLGALYFRK